MNGTTNGGVSAAMVRAEAPATRAIEPTNMGELRALAAEAAKTGFFGAKSPEQALLVMMAGRDLGLSYSQALRSFHVIEGKPTLSADGMVATCLVRRDVCAFFRTVSVDDKAATVETQRVGQEAQRYTFTLADAQRAGVTNKPTWQRYPSRMLLARARAALARDVYPDLLLGLYDPDEIEPTPAPARAAPAREELRGEVVQPPPATPSGTVDLVGIFRAEMARIGRGGTKEEARDVMARIARSSLTPAERAGLRDYAAAMNAAIRAREAIGSTHDSAPQIPEGDPEPREPGEEG